MSWSFDVDTLSSVLQHLDVNGVVQAARVSRLWNVTVAADPVVQLPVKALAKALSRRQSDVAESLARLEERPSCYIGYNETLNLPCKRSFSEGDSAVLELQRRETEALLTPISLWLSKRYRCEDVNTTFAVEIS